MLQIKKQDLFNFSITLNNPYVPMFSNTIIKFLILKKFQQKDQPK